MSDTLLKNAEYVYSGYLKWELNRYSCSVRFYSEEPLPDLDYVICSIVSSAENCKYDKRDLGVMLGFNLIDRQPEMYYDEAEDNLYKELLSIVKGHKLIVVNDKNVELTNLGRISLKNKKLYTFFNGTQCVYEHRNFYYPYPTAFLMFPFFKDMGIYTNLGRGEQYWPEDSEIPTIIGRKPDQLIKRIQLQSKDLNNVYEATISQYYDIETKKVKIDLYFDRQNDQYVPVVLNGEEIAPKATELFNYEENARHREKAIQICLFQKLWDDENSVLNYENLKPYFDLVDYEELTKDSRMLWSDERLFEQIASVANYNCWENISNNCEMSVLYDKLAKYVDKFDWITITERADDDFLLKYFNDYPWDLEGISIDPSRRVSTIEQLIISAKKYLEEWDWDALSQRLEKSFVLSNLPLVNVDLEKYTEDTAEIQNCILNNPNKKWSWSKIENTFDLSFILKNICVLQPHLGFVKLFDRVFNDMVWANKYINDRRFIDAVSKDISEGGLLSSSLFNEKDYAWTNEIIDFFSSRKLIVWESTQYSYGFECNNNLKWTYDFFVRYYKKITDIGKSRVSSNIKDEKIISDYPDFGWDWTALSMNQNISPDYIRANMKLPWNWQILTKKMFFGLKYENIGHKDFVDKWDWNYLSKNLPADFIKNNLNKYVEYWDWDVIFDRLITVGNKVDISSLLSLAITINLVKDETRKGAVWLSLSKKFSYEELKELLRATAGDNRFNWDKSYFYSNPEFNVFKDLADCQEFIDWTLLSSSKIMDEQLKYDPKLGIREISWENEVKKLIADYKKKWDFKGLSTFESLNGMEWFLEDYALEIDWDYVSLHSSLFAVSDKQKLNNVISQFKRYVSFAALSQRTDVDIEQIIKGFPDAEYDYNALLINRKWNVKLTTINRNPQYEWNWKAIGESDSFKPDGPFLLDHIDKQWDWWRLTQKNWEKVWSDLSLLQKMIDSTDIRTNADWRTLTKRRYFPMRIDFLLALREYGCDINWSVLSASDRIMELLNYFEEDLDWNEVSKNKKFDVNNASLLEKYKDRINWREVCVRTDFTFNDEILERFTENIDWTRVSESEMIEFTEALVDKYDKYWVWPVLVRNRAYINRVGNDNKGFQRRINTIQFIEAFNGYAIPKPRVYHFTHMSNAVKIINSHLLQSRNSANGAFENSAGSIINLRSEGHNFVRFYFNHGSPTQFYNEFLGMDERSDSRYYETAVGFGLPKCPLPVFFIIDIDELLTKLPDKCYYSNGNMQKRGTSRFKVIDQPNFINVSGIFNRRDKDARQQEFLVMGELDLLNLYSLKICCYDKYQRDMLRKLVSGSQFVDRIYDRADLYIDKNPKLIFDETDEILDIQTNYCNPFEFRIEYSDGNIPIILNKESIIRQKDNNIYMDADIKIMKSTHFSIYFEVSDPRKEKWLIYKN